MERCQGRHTQQPLHELVVIDHGDASEEGRGGFQKPSFLGEEDLGFLEVSPPYPSLPAAMGAWSGLMDWIDAAFDTADICIPTRLKSDVRSLPPWSGRA